MPLTQPTNACYYPRTIKSKFKNVLVSGCSFTFNNSKTDACSWPYYLRELANIDIIDGSQSGAGNDHIFNSIINEIEVNEHINPRDTLVIIMWAGFSRVDFICEHDITKNWYWNDNYYKFNDKFSTFSLWPNSSNKYPDLFKLEQIYRKNIGFDAQIYASNLKIIALKNYLENKGFNYIFTQSLTNQDGATGIKGETVEEFEIPKKLSKQVTSVVSNMVFLGNFADSIGSYEDDGHPSHEAHLQWTKKHLIPRMVKDGFANYIK
jgi:hypothetical protein